MYTDFFKTFTDQTEQSLQPYLKFNKLMTKNVEVLTELQLNAIRTYSEMGMTQMKAATEVRDVTSLTAFNGQQLAVLTKLSQQLTEDSSKLQAIAKEFKDDVEQMTSENLKTVTPA
ncbi:phasin family protein [Vibrio genomosp. F10]|uniref:Phasin family protein n=2 Tax=Vibrio genomosp. F10 TaxID=723171 RepID=A0A1B9R285_9VIBR|nr:phasin family protein [Vibrio genomosp. F10]OCH78144.1 phasin family protein [Vibrio genomosp. F10]OEE31369.1 phasin family protein [Vibrio genomosp. F10 str. ZF-129]OEE96461.1 phasin family protein [Vibrio genomosp. F10 str. 9ZC157]OEE96886.1 phasin family protein [Vibrio genomosp. F10 str. 9ZD137]OEF10580.1 phasin family protein [Vibrio genomosp. F10 str. 9ZB36]